MEYKKIQSYTFIGALLAITAIFVWMIGPYLYAVFWAAVLASIFRPLHRHVLRACHQKTTIAAGVTVVIILLIFVIPLAGVISLIIQQTVVLYHDFGNKATFTQVSDFIQGILEWPLLQRYVGPIDVTERLSNYGTTISKFVYQFVASSGQNTARLVIQFFIMIYTLYYFLKDGNAILRKLMHLLPLGDRYEQRLYDRFVSTARATLKGTLLIGTVQGVIGTVAFLIAGVPASAFWGIIMVVLSIIPGVGASIILLPGAIILLIMGNIWQAVVVVVAMAAAGLVDNVLRGPLVGKDAQMHPLLIFFATLGGLLAFGITGIVIGPVITAFLLSIWQIYEEKYKTDLDKAD